VIYGLVALVQRDMKKPYGLLSGMGFVTFGFFLFNDLSARRWLVPYD
jgi:NADH:ubiquinone oxidoreductase subunit 4 (subunit M)